MRLIDPIKLKEAITVSAILQDRKHIFDIIDEQPTAQPEIVRCRDCRWSPWRSRMYADSAVEIKVCSHSRSPEGFCAWGKEVEKCGD